MEAERSLVDVRLLVWVALCAMAAMVVYVTTADLSGLSAHAVEKHGDEALIVRQCFERRGAIQEWLQPNGRIARVCELEDGRYGIEILEDGKNVTAFVKNKLKSLVEIERYFKNRGAQLLWSAR